MSLLLDKAGVRNLIAAQSLLSVYVHLGVSHRIPNESLFYGKGTELLVDTRHAWSTFMTVVGDHTLLASALKDPNNQCVISTTDTSHDGHTCVSMVNLCCSLIHVSHSTHRTSSALSSCQKHEVEYVRAILGMVSISFGACPMPWSADKGRCCARDDPRMVGEYLNPSHWRKSSQWFIQSLATLCSVVSRGP